MNAKIRLNKIYPHLFILTYVERLLNLPKMQGMRNSAGPGLLTRQRVVGTRHFSPKT